MGPISFPNDCAPWGFICRPILPYQQGVALQPSFLLFLLRPGHLALLLPLPLSSSHLLTFPWSASHFLSCLHGLPLLQLNLFLLPLIPAACVHRTRAYSKQCVHMCREHGHTGLSICQAFCARTYGGWNMCMPRVDSSSLCSAWLLSVVRSTEKMCVPESWGAHCVLYLVHAEGFWASVCLCVLMDVDLSEK